jgi:hypothetical protein
LKNILLCGCPVNSIFFFLAECVLLSCSASELRDDDAAMPQGDPMESERFFPALKIPRQRRTLATFEY